MVRFDKEVAMAEGPTLTFNDTVEIRLPNGATYGHAAVNKEDAVG